VLILLKLRSAVGWSLLELTRLMQTMAPERPSLWERLCPREKTLLPQLFLFNAAAGC